MPEYKGRRKSDRKEALDLETLMGKTPPQAIDIEEAVLAALLLEPNCLDEAMEELSTPECFYSEKNRIIYSAMRELRKVNSPVDLYTVTEMLRKQGDLDTVGGADFLAELSTRVGAAAHVEFYTKVVKQKYIQRQLITASYKIINSAYDEAVNVENLIDTAQTEIFAAVDSNTTRDAQNVGDVINKALQELEKMQQMDGSLSGVPSGFPTLDGMTLGWQSSDLIILAARPSVGKTAFALNVARNAAVRGYPTAVFSLEMPAIQLVKRLMISETGIDGKKLKGGTKLEEGDWDIIEDRIRSLAAAPLYIDDTPSLPVMEFRSKVKKLVKQKGVRLIVVDYLQLMQGPAELRGMREQEVAAISRTLKATAKEHNVPIIALSQLSRQAVSRTGSNNRPQLSDLRESGSIEQDADMVLFIHRLDYANLGMEGVTKGETQLIIAKHRNGEIGDVPLRFHDSEARFSDAADEVLSEQFQAVQADYGSAMNDLNYGGPTFDSDFGGMSSDF